ncbi:hypothetical protein ACTWQF_10680 [Streptomyces sp. 8N114]|uniref:hypothetical protein n=1 Tax=Streptomyces sp. 8N114 TaxID=3457419 RepID=UPI003FD55CDE
MAKKNKYRVDLVTWRHRKGQGVRPDEHTPDGPKLNVGLMDSDGRKVSTKESTKSWNSDSLGKGMGAVVGMVVNDPGASSSFYPGLGSRPDKKEKACENYRKLAESYGVKGRTLKAMWTSGRMGATAGAWIGMAWKCATW